jgi:TRAP-type C4-dicarboxylate transport system permease small subunit
MMTITVALQVICRYWVGISLTWSEELSRYLMVWLTFLGAGIAFKKGAHMSFHLLLQRVPPEARFLAKVFTLCAILIYLIILAVKGIQLSLFNMAQYSPAMGIPVGTIYLAIPAGSVVMAVHGLTQLAGLFPDLRHTWRRTGRC